MNSQPIRQAIQSLAIQQRVPLAVDCEPDNEDTFAALPGESSVAGVRVRFGVEVPVTVTMTGDRIQVRGNLDELNWAAYEAVALGLRKLIAVDLDIGYELLTSEKLLEVTNGRAIQYVEIVVPDRLSTAFSQADTQSSVEVFLSTVKGEPSRFDVDVAVGSLATDEAQKKAQAAVGIALEVRAAAGGKTLPAACFIEGTGWNAALHLSGRLGDKPRGPASKPTVVSVECRLDGYMKSTRVVHLLPLSKNGKARRATKIKARTVVSFDEETWFETVASLTSKRGQVVRATYREVNNGSRTQLQLVKLDEVDTNEDSGTQGERAATTVQ